MDQYTSCSNPCSNPPTPKKKIPSCARISSSSWLCEGHAKPTKTFLILTLFFSHLSKGTCYRSVFNCENTLYVFDFNVLFTYRDIPATNWKRQISDIGLGVKWPWFSKGTFFEKAERCLWEEEEASFRSLSNCAWQHNITPLEKSCKGPHFHVVPGFKLDQQQFSCKQILFMGAGGKSNYALLFLTPLEIGVFFLYIQKRNSIPSDVSLLLWKTLDGRSFSSLGGSVGLGQLFWLCILHHTLSLLD